MDLRNHLIYTPNKSVVKKVSKFLMKNGCKWVSVGDNDSFIDTVESEITFVVVNSDGYIQYGSDLDIVAKLEILSTVYRIITDVDKLIYPLKPKKEIPPLHFISKPKRHIGLVEPYPYTVTEYTTTSVENKKWYQRLWDKRPKPFKWVKNVWTHMFEKTPITLYFFLTTFLISNIYSIINGYRGDGLMFILFSFLISWIPFTIETLRSDD